MAECAVRKTAATTKNAAAVAASLDTDAPKYVDRAAARREAFHQTDKPKNEKRKKFEGPPPPAVTEQPNKDGIEESNVGSKMLEKMVRSAYRSPWYVAADINLCRAGRRVLGSERRARASSILCKPLSSLKELVSDLQRVRLLPSVALSSLLLTTFASQGRPSEHSTRRLRVTLNLFARRPRVGTRVCNLTHSVLISSRAHGYRVSAIPSLTRSSLQAANVGSPLVLCPLRCSSPSPSFNTVSRRTRTLDSSSPTPPSTNDVGCTDLFNAVGERRRRRRLERASFLFPRYSTQLHRRRIEQQRRRSRFGSYLARCWYSWPRRRAASRVPRHLDANLTADFQPPPLSCISTSTSLTFTSSSSTNPYSIGGPSLHHRQRQRRRDARQTSPIGSCSEGARNSIHQLRQVLRTEPILERVGEMGGEGVGSAVPLSLWSRRRSHRRQRERAP